MRARTRSDASIDNIIARALWATEVKVFLRRRLDAEMIDLAPNAEGFAVAVRFKTQVEAEQFHKLLMSRRGRVRR